MCSLQELSTMGFKLVAYPLSLLGVSVHAMRQALKVHVITVLHDAQAK